LPTPKKDLLIVYVVTVTRKSKFTDANNAFPIICLLHFGRLTILSEAPPISSKYAAAFWLSAQLISRKKCVTIPYHLLALQAGKVTKVYVDGARQSKPATFSLGLIRPRLLKSLFTMDLPNTSL
jgi:hypothetical protein